MASACRSAVMTSARSLALRPNALLRSLAAKAVPTPPLFSSSVRTSPRIAALRVASVLGGLETMMPLHSAIASTRLRSSIAVDSTYWSWLSQDFAVPR